MIGRHRFALAGLLVGLAAVMIVWLGIDRRPPEWDHANHLERALACHRSLSAPGRDWLQEILAESSFTLRAADVRYGGVRLPGFLVNWIVRNFDPTPRLRRLPMPVSMAPIRIQRERLEVGEDASPTAATQESR